MTRFCREIGCETSCFHDHKTAKDSRGQANDEKHITIHNNTVKNRFSRSLETIHDRSAYQAFRTARCLLKMLVAWHAWHRHDTA
jgi:hypothetical protein